MPTDATTNGILANRLADTARAQCFPLLAFRRLREVGAALRAAVEAKVLERLQAHRETADPADPVEGVASQRRRRRNEGIQLNIVHQIVSEGMTFIPSRRVFISNTSYLRSHSLHRRSCDFALVVELRIRDAVREDSGETRGRDSSRNRSCHGNEAMTVVVAPHFVRQKSFDRFWQHDIPLCTR